MNKKLNNLTNKKASKGITLIALVITIIVLLILAGVSISLLTGDNSVVQKAATAKETSKNAEKAERAKLAYMSALTAGNGNFSKEKFQE